MAQKVRTEAVKQGVDGFNVVADMKVEEKEGKWHADRSESNT